MTTIAIIDSTKRGVRVRYYASHRDRMPTETHYGDAAVIHEIDGGRAYWVRVGQYSCRVYTYSLGQSMRQSRSWTSAGDACREYIAKGAA